MTFSLKTRILFFIVLSGLAVMLVAYLGLEVLHKTSRQDNLARITQLMRSTVNVVDQLERAAAAGQIEEAKAKEMATRILRENKYHSSEYVYVVDNNMDFVATPLDPQLHGTSFNDFKDAQGKSIGAMVRRLVGDTTGRIISYEWNSERDGEVVDLTSVVQKTPIWGWYVGTGVSYKEADDRYWATAIWLLGLSILIAIIISLSVGLFGLKLARSLGGEISDVVAIVQRISRGDLSIELDDSHCDKNSVVGAMAYMQRELRKVLSSIHQVADDLKKQTDEADHRAVELDGVTRLLSSESSMMSAGIVELTASAQEVANHAHRTAERVAEADQNGATAMTYTAEASETIVLLEQQIDSVGKSIEQLDDQVNSIASVLAVITSIAEQTNLLALNAAIEAARAGEQGRGFAVVADEVRQLASRTQMSTEEIQQMINSLQAAKNEAKNSVASSIETSEKAVVNSRNVTEALNNVKAYLSEIASMSQQISVAASEQLNAGQDAEKRIVSISDSAENAAQVSTSTHQSTEETSRLASSLEEEIKKFKL